MENNTDNIPTNFINASREPLKQESMSFKEKLKSIWLTSIYPQRKAISSLFILLFITVSTASVLYMIRGVQRTQVGASGPALTLTPTNTNPKVGDQIAVAVYMDTQGMQVSAADIRISYDSNVLTATSITNSGFLPTVLKAGSVSSGSATIVLGCLVDATAAHPVTGTGILANINFTVKSAGTTTVSFANGTALAAVGQTSNVAGTLTPVQITVVTATTSPTPTPTPTKTPTQTPTLTPTPTKTPTPTPSRTPTPTPTPTPTKTPTPTPTPRRGR